MSAASTIVVDVAARKCPTNLRLHATGLRSSLLGS